MTKGQIITRVLVWGIGAIAIIFGLCSMTFHTELNIDYPEYYVVGSIELLSGIGLYIFDVLINDKKAKRKHELKLLELQLELQRK